MICWLLFACRPDPGSPDLSGTDGVGTSAADTSTPPPWEGDPRYVLVDPIATVVPGEPGEAGFGSLLAVGGDWDRDGVLEWSVGAPADSDKAVVRVYEGTEPVLERHPEDSSWHTNWPTNVAHVDVDGDGFKDLVFSFNQGQYGRIQSVRGGSDVDNLYAIEAPGLTDGHGGVAMSLRGAGDGSLVAGWEGAGTGILRGHLPAGPVRATSDDPVWLESAEYTALRLDRSFSPGESQTLMSPLAVDGSLWTGLIFTSDHGNRGELWTCPDGVMGLELAVNCHQVASGDVGAVLAAGDLDGDGQPEVASTGLLPRESSGLITVFDISGGVRATIRGTRVAQLGLPLGMAVDGDGEGWLLAAPYNSNGTEPAAVYAFRGTDVVGELTDEDAERIYVSEIGGRFPAFEVYRPTPDAEPQLLLGHPAAGAVYMVPFTPGEPVPSR